MLLITEENLIDYQKGYIPILSQYVEKLRQSQITTDDMTPQIDYISSLLKFCFVGELDYSNFLEYTNKVVNNLKCEFFLKPHTKNEIRTFCRGLQ